MSKRILVVDDQEDLRGVLRDLLTGSGYTVIEAADGEAGVAKARSEHPDLILMDMSLPEIDGVWTVDGLCAALEGHRLIVLDPQAPTPLAAALSDAARDAPIALVVGPDAGFAGSELARLRAAGAEVCHLGGTTLRAETAAIVAAGITLALTDPLDRGPAAVPTHGETTA